MVKAGNAQDCKTIVFRHEFQLFKLANYDLGGRSVQVSYDRTSPILIGMDILSELDIHIGNGKNGKHVFLACMHQQITDAYKEALLHYFGLQWE